MRFASIGDCCIDVYPNKNLLGGTAYNSAIVSKRFGADVSLISAIGNDSNGSMYQKALKNQDINSTHLKIIPGATSTVDITLDEQVSPIFGEWNLGVLEDWRINNEDLRYIKQHDIAKAILLKPLEKNFVQFCVIKMPQTLKVGDFDGTTPYSYVTKDIANYTDGLDIIVKSLDASEMSELDFLCQLANAKKKLVLVTLGNKGSICFFGKKTYTQNAIKMKTTNATGFGDAYIAVFLLTYFQTKNIQKAMEQATLALTHLPQS